MTSPPELAGPRRLFEVRLTENHAVIVLVSVVDRRLASALRLVSRLRCPDSRALHVSVDPDQTRRLATDWMKLGLSWLPLHIRDATTVALPVAAYEAVREETAAIESVTVVLPELNDPAWWHPLLHRRSARHIAARLQDLPHVTAVIVPFSVTGSRSRRRT